MSSSSYLLSIDQGTTGTTILLVDDFGKIVSKGYQEFTQYYPYPGWVEHDPEEIWNATQKAISEVLDNTNIKNNISAIGIANQRETTVVWDRDTGTPIYPAIVWQCRRTSDICADLNAQDGISEQVKSKTGLVIDPYFSATKVAWILDNVEGARDKAKRGNLAFGTIDTWLLWKLTDGEVHKTDYTNASRTLLFNIDTLTWDDTLLDIFNISKNILPDVCPSAYNFGNVKVHPLHNIPIAGIAGDQQSALFGQLCWKPGMLKNTYGTGCFLMLNTGTKRIESQNGLLTTLACSLNEKPVYALEGSVFIAGAAIQWLRDGLRLINSAAETEEIAKSVNDSAGVVVVPAFTGLGAPYWDADARGAIFGLTRGTTHEHIVRATLESIAFQSTDVVRSMIDDSEICFEQLRVDGGAVANNFLMQFQADLLDMDVERPIQIETTGLGAAYLAGISSGVWNNVEELEKYRKIDTVFNPEMNKEHREQKISDWQTSIQRLTNVTVGD
ncbi:glycerol kinase GlpK [Candidatus Poribacteria bacterium]|nr:glycerol kinase GlpK [Candidatus Poribacteria bacterium]